MDRGTAIVAERRLLIVETDTCTQRPTPQLHLRGVEQRRAPRRIAEVARDVELSLLDLDGVVGEHQLDTLIGIGEDQLVDTIAFESHGSRHIEVFVERKCAKTCRITLRGIIFYNHLLGQRMLTLSLLQGEHRAGRKILIKGHTIVQIGPRRYTRKCIIITLIGKSQSIAQRKARVVARIVVIGLQLLATRLVNKSIGPAALIGRIDRKCVAQRHRTSAPLDLRTTATAVLPIESLTIVFISELSVSMAEITTYRHSNLLAYKRIVRRTNFHRIGCSVLRRQTCARVRKGRQRMHVHHARHRIAAIERTLRTAQQLDTTQVENIEIESIFVENGGVIDIQAHRGLVDSRTHTAHIDRRGHTRPIVGYIEIGSVRRHRTHIINRLTLSLVHKHLGLCNRVLNQPRLLDLCRNRHLGNVVHSKRIDTLCRHHSR